MLHFINFIKLKKDKDKDKNKKKNQKEESSHLECFYKIKSPQDIAQISLDKQKSQNLFLYGNLRNDIFQKIRIKDVLQEKQDKRKQKQHDEHKLREYVKNKIVPEIFDEYDKKYRVNKVFCKALKIKFENIDLYTTLGESQRKRMWLIGTDALFQIKENKNYYEKIKTNKAIPNVYEDFIEKDVTRTFNKEENENKLSFVKQATQTLRNVLSVHSKRNCISGYTQGMNFLAKFILSQNFTEEEAFWIFEYFLESVIPLDYYTHSMIGLLADQNIFKNLLECHNPKVFKKFQEIKIDINIITTSWFICMYTNSLSKEICQVVFDHCILYGAKTVFCVGLVIMDYLANDILNENGPSVIMMIEKKARQITDYTLIHKKLNEIYISKKGIELQREIYREVYQKQMDADQKLHNKIRNYDSIKCNRNWPICLVNLHTEQKNNFKGVFVLQNNYDLQIKKDHFSLKTLQQNISLLKSEDFSNIDNFLIVRLNHICTDNHQIQQSPKKSQNQQSQIQQSQVLQPYTQHSKIQQQEKMYQAQQNQNNSSEGNLDSLSPDKQHSFLRLAKRVDSYTPTEEEYQRIIQNRNKTINLVQIQEEENNNNQESPHNQFENNKIQFEKINDIYEETPKSIFNIFHSTKLQDDKDDMNDLNEKSEEEDEINNLRKSSYFRFYSIVKVNNPVFKSLQKKDISLAQSQYFDQVKK